MKVHQCMTRDVRIADPADTLQHAAKTMADIDAGFLPVGENDRLVGIITDRDIAIRAVGAGRSADAKVRDVMSDEVKYCYDDNDVGMVLENMGEQQIRRLPVIDRDKRLVGVGSITDRAANGDTRQTGETLCEIARPSVMHSQSI